MKQTFDPAEIEWLVYHYRLGSLDEQGSRRLESILSDSDEVRRVAARYLMNEVVLRRELQVAEVTRLFTDDDTTVPSEEYEGEKVELARRGASTLPRRRWSWSALAASILAIVVGVLGVNNFTLHWKLRNQANLAPIASYPERSVVTLVDSTLCLWDSGSIPGRNTERRLAPNTGLRLLEGIAEIELQGPHVGDASLQIEGPASWLFTDDGQLRLSYGKVTVDASTGEETLSIDTPLGRVLAQGHASLGVSCFGNNLEIHAFSGRASVESLWMDGGDSGGVVDISAGEMVRLSIQQDAPYLITRDVADATRFASRLSMLTDDLMLDHQYAAVVKKHKPLAYWRFESISGGRVENEMGPHLPIRILGDVALRGGEANHYAEFVDSLEEQHINAMLVTDEPISVDPLKEYSIEIWVKPSHYQQASIVGLVGGPLDENHQSRHGMLLELAGPHPPVTSTAHPGRVRYLNRFPAARYPQRNESVFSQDAYELRRWQHVVVVKDTEQKRLYINGVLQAERRDTNPLSGGLTLLVGRLHQQRPERRFIGQFDDLAIYDHALTTADVEEHYRLARPRTESDTNRVGSI